jgi:hypothetical protein
VRQTISGRGDRGRKTMKKECYDVTLHVEVHDKRALWEKARQSYQGENPSGTPEEMDSFFGDGTDEDEDIAYDLHGCLRQLLDPGSEVLGGGAEIQDSSVEYTDTIGEDG